MQLSSIAFELVIFAVYLAMVVCSYHFLTRVFLRIVDPKGEYTRAHNIPLPGLVRGLFLMAAFILPLVLASLLATIVRLFI